MKMSAELAAQPHQTEFTAVHLGNVALSPSQITPDAPPSESAKTPMPNKVADPDIETEGILVSPERAAAFAQKFYDEHARAIHTNRILIPPNAQEDVRQVTLLKALRNLHTRPEDAKGERKWLLAIAHNTAINMWRKDKNRLLFVDHAQHPELFETQAFEAQTADSTFSIEQLLHGVGNELNEKDRHFIEHVYGQGRSLKEYAQLSGIPHGTVKSRGSIVRKKLKELHADGKL